MGRAILEACRSDAGVTVTAAIENPDSPALGRDAGEIAGIGRLGIPIVGAVAAVTGAFDVLVDFTQARAVQENLKQCRAMRRRMVIGTTGLNARQKAAIRKASRDIAIVFSPNMSIGVNLCFRLAEMAARAIGDGVDIEIIEAHHNRKLDAPSGTAVRLGEIIAGALNRDLARNAVYGRVGHTGARDPRAIGYSSIRAGDIVGDHTVLFAGPGERVEITHRAHSRMTFAAGAIRAAQWLMSRDRGLYDMLDVLGLRSAD
jgi:4-hydroxy-tetrahydrodipicolinate reductase